MNKKLMRGSLFICLMFIISISLTGCDMAESISKIVTGVKGTLGKVMEGAGNIVQKIVPVVKNVVEAVKPVVSSIGDAISQITGKSNSLAEKVDNIVGKVDEVLDKVSGVGEKLVDMGQSWQTDSAGNAASGTSEVGQGVADPTADTPVAVSSTNTGTSTNTNTNTNTSSARTLEELAQLTKDALGDSAKVEIIKDGQATEVTSSNTNTNTKTNTNVNTNLSTLNDELLTEDEKNYYTNEVRNNFNAMKNTIDNLKSTIYSGVDDAYNSKEVKSIVSQLDNYKSELDAIVKNPASADSEKRYKELVKKFKDTKKQINNLNAKYEDYKGAMQDFMRDVEKAVMIVDDAFGKLNKGKK